MVDIKEKYLVDLCDELKRTITAMYVVRNPHYLTYDNPDPIHNVRYETEIVAKDIALTILMCLMGYTIPKGYYGGIDYSELCGWLDDNDVRNDE